MKKRKAVILIVLCAVVFTAALFAFTGCWGVTAPVNQTNIDIAISDCGTNFTAKQTFTFVNNQNKTLDEVYFYFYPNAFSNFDKCCIG